MNQFINNKMGVFFMRKRSGLFVIFFLFLFLSPCNKNKSKDTIVDDFINSSIKEDYAGIKDLKGNYVYRQYSSDLSDD